MITACVSLDDVIGALAIGRDRELPIVIHGAGTSHDAAVDRELVIDLSALKTIEVDRASRTVSVAPGVTWAELDEATQEHGLAVTGARLSRLGVAESSSATAAAGSSERSAPPAPASSEPRSSWRTVTWSR